jgi:chromosome segregation ATPase
MPTQEERIAALERTTREHRSVLQTFTYELTSLKGQINVQGDAIQELKGDMTDSFKELAAYMSQTEKQLDTRFNKIEATMATKEDITSLKNEMTAMESRILDAFKQLVTIISTQQPPKE